MPIIKESLAQKGKNAYFVNIIQLKIQFNNDHHVSSSLCGNYVTLRVSI